MKTKIITSLKKELLIIELPEETYFEVFKHGILFKDHLEAEREFVEGSYTLLGSPDEIKEDEAKELVEGTEMGVKLNSKKYKYRAYDSQLGYATATESLLSALESEIYWNVNPFGLIMPNEHIDTKRKSWIQPKNHLIKKWKQAQEKTFDKKRVKMFVKN